MAFSNMDSNKNSQLKSDITLSRLMYVCIMCMLGRDRWIDGKMDRRIDGKVDRWIDG